MSATAAQDGVQVTARDGTGRTTATGVLRAAAAGRILAAEPMPVGNLSTELDDLRGRHA